MKSQKSRSGVALLLSPYGLAMFSYALFVTAWLVPPFVYSWLLEERNLLFLDPASMLLYTLCVGAFVVGVGSFNVFFPTEMATPSPIEVRIRPSVFLLIPVIAGTLLTVESVQLLLRDNPYIADMIMAQQGYLLKENLDVHQPLGLASIWLLGICWWAMWRRHQLVIEKRWDRWLVSGAINVALLSIAASATLKLGRGELMPVLAGSGVVYLVRKCATGQLSARFLARFAGAGAIAVVATFFLFSMMRGTQALDVYLGDLLAYTVSSYNRLAAIVNGRLHYPYAGRGVYLSSFLSFNGALNRILPVAATMHWPSFEQVWDSEFGATWRAGLDGSRIWSGAFGYLFSDFGWLSPAVVFFYGLLYGWSWRSMKRGHNAGIILYPWFAFCVLFWFGTNFLLDTKMVVLFLVSLFMSGYERLFIRTATNVT